MKPNDLLEIQYTRDDVNYETWYSDWMKQLANRYTVDELNKMHGIAKSEAEHGSQVHLRAIQKSTSMQSNSQHRAQARNVVSAAGDTAIAVMGAIEIHYLFPEHANRRSKED